MGMGEVVNGDDAAAAAVVKNVGCQKVLCVLVVVGTMDGGKLLYAEDE